MVYKPAKFQLPGRGTTVKGSCHIFQRDLISPPSSIPPPSFPHSTPNTTPRYLSWKMLSALWSHAAVTSHRGSPPPPLLSLGAQILLLLLCGRALSIPVECPPGSAQCPLGSVGGDGLDAKVLILGAGVAGITAAQTLESHGISDFLIVEAHHEVGGRLKSRQFGSHDNIRTRTNDTLKSIEVGAQWIQGYHEHNPIWGLAKKHGIKTRLSDFSESVSESLPFLPVTCWLKDASYQSAMIPRLRAPGTC